METAIFKMMQSLSELLLGEVSIDTFSNLEELALQDGQRSSAFGLTPQNVLHHIQQRFELFQTLYPEFVALCDQLKLTPLPIDILWDLWLPLAIQISQWRNECQNQRLIQGFLGAQGSGKTTLTVMLSLILRQLDCKAVSLSIDDLYLTYHDRSELQKSDPRLVRRGPPGTHDIQQGLQVLQQFRQGDFPIDLPRFDKSAHNGAGDRTLPETINHADILLFEGWFVGVRPINPILFENPRAPILTERDRQFARDMNERLRAYLPLWERLDRLIVLSVPEYQLSKQWRKQAEHKMIAQGKSGMSDAEIDEFVEYFWKALHPELFIEPLVRESAHVDFVIEINSNHQPKSLYRPRSVS